MRIAARFEAAGLVPMGESWYHSFRFSDRIGRNVVGLLPGRSGRYIVVGAHYDALGTLDGRVYPGADSNASGVAALLQLSSALSGCGKPETGIAFVAFDAHDYGAAGAPAFLEQAPFKTAMMVNLDIIGSSLAPVNRTVPDYLIILGARPWQMQLERLAGPLGLKLYYDYYGSKAFTDMFYLYSGEHAAFLNAGIKALLFTSGISMNTNKVTDTASTLDYPLLERRIELLKLWLTEMIK